jgi:transposase InsO family protein
MLSEAWTNPNSRIAYSGRNKIYNYYQGDKTVKEIESELAGVSTYTLHKERKRVKNFNPFFVYRKHQYWQMDIMYLPLYPKENENYKYLVCLLEVFSRKLFIKPLKTIDAKSVLAAFKELQAQIAAIPENLVVDRGSEFTNNSFKKHCLDNNINLIFTFNESKAAHVERCQRSFQVILYKIMEEKQSRNYMKFLDDTLHIYNNRENRSTGFSPNEAYLQENENSVLENLEKNIYSKAVKLRKTPKYKVGDTVRISFKRMPFERAYNAKFTEEVFKIRKILTNLPQPRYILSEYSADGEIIKGSFYEREITLATHQTFKIERIIKQKRVKGKLMYYVKWMNYPESENSWVGKEAISKF